MRRREFIALLGVGAAWPRAARAQQARVPRIGILVPGNPEPFLSVFRKGLREIGYIDGQNLRIEFRSAEGMPNRLPALAAELVGLKVDLIVAWQTPAVTAAKQATRDIPIVMLAGDPVATGLVASLARPGGNITGVTGLTVDLAGKTLELVREILPSARRVAVLANAADPFTKPFLEQTQRAARTLGIELRPILVRGADEFEAAFAEMKRERADAVIVQPSLPRKIAVELALKHRLPAASSARPFAEEGGLLSYAANFEDLCRKAAAYVDKILKGAKPADLPVEQATKFELAINLKTAKALGIVVPATLLARADEVIE